MQFGMMKNRSASDVCVYMCVSYGYSLFACAGYVSVSACAWYVYMCVRVCVHAKLYGHIIIIGFSI